MSRLVGDARTIFDAAVGCVQPDVLLRDYDLEPLADRPLAAYKRVWVLGMGKGSLAMASVIEDRLGDRLDGGLVVTARSYSESLPDQFVRPKRIEILEGGHPIPDAGSLEGARRILEYAARAQSEDLVIVLISGGGSSVCTDFLGDVTLDEAGQTFQLLLQAGLDIHAVNTVRKHMSRIGGGRLAAAIYPAPVVGLIMSDVVGDDVSIIASGPTSADASSFEDAVGVLKDAEIWERIPSSVRDFFASRLGTARDETPKPGSRCFDMVTNRIIATNETALEGARKAAERLGYHTRILERDVTGEARVVGKRLIEHVLSERRRETCCFLAGGETSVTVHGSGKGGRNQETALSAAITLSGIAGKAAFLSGGTDGIDGPTDAAGAIVTNRTVADARTIGLDPNAYLANNDSYGFFDVLGGLIKTGPTHTNVMDLQIVLI